METETKGEKKKREEGGAHPHYENQRRALGESTSSHRAKAPGSSRGETTGPDAMLVQSQPWTQRQGEPTMQRRARVSVTNLVNSVY
ncbi:hypothetical protein ILYODFUR_034308 [Ilyodon furcidens]|uniref:Uncharacterized protein n=1 Tax=Ilyodon furcidens TaxID=33524 RepID=A0ABV0UBI2_9TELE